jgi:hypothetical protein
MSSPGWLVHSGFSLRALVEGSLEHSSHCDVQRAENFASGKNVYPASVRQQVAPNARYAVVFHHFGFHPPSWMDWGPVGPSVFFLLSGYLITLSLCKLQDKNDSGLWEL